jgi:hypothetical protein
MQHMHYKEEKMQAANVERKSNIANESLTYLLPVCVVEEYWKSVCWILA